MGPPASRSRTEREAARTDAHAARAEAAPWSRRPLRSQQQPGQRQLQEAESRTITILSSQIDVRLILKLALGDGHCFFRALAWVVHGDEKLWQDIKARIVERMRSPEFAARNHQRCSYASVEAWQERVTNLELQGASSDFWAGEPEIAAAEEVLDVPIHVYQTLGGGDELGRIRGEESRPPGMEDRPTIRLRYTLIDRPGGKRVGHYDALVDRDVGSARYDSGTTLMSEYRRRSHAAEAEAARALAIRRQEEDRAAGEAAVALVRAHLAGGAHRPSAAAAAVSASPTEGSPRKRRRMTADGASRRARGAATSTTEKPAATAGTTRAVTQRTTTATTAVGAAAAATEAVAAAATDGTATAAAGSAGSTTATAERGDGTAAMPPVATMREAREAAVPHESLRVRPANWTKKTWYHYKRRQRAQKRPPG